VGFIPYAPRVAAGAPDCRQPATYGCATDQRLASLQRISPRRVNGDAGQSRHRRDPVAHRLGVSPATLYRYIPPRVRSSEAFERRPPARLHHFNDGPASETLHDSTPSRPLPGTRKSTLSGHSAQRRDSCNVVTFQMEVMRLHPAAISNRPFAPLQPSLWSRSEVRAIGVLPCSPRPQGTAKSSRFHNFRASSQKRQTASPRSIVVRQTRFAGFSGQEKRIVCTCLESSAAVLANKGRVLLTINATGAVEMLTFCHPVFAIVSSYSQSSGHAYIICK
jgi:hypothetical protein